MLQKLIFKNRAFVAVITVVICSIILVACTDGSDATPDIRSGSEQTEAPTIDRSASYVDGKYKSIGTYTSPAGRESLELEITLEDEVVTAVKIKPNATDFTSLSYQKRFADGIAEVVIGARIDEALSPGRINGSSLTTAGFDEALKSIAVQAKSE